MTGAPVDRDVLRRLEIDLGGPEVVKEMVASFMSDAVPLLTAMRAGAARGDARAVEDGAHVMKSVSAALGALRLAELCKDLEIRAREGRIEDGPARVVEVEQEFLRVRPALELGVS